MDAKWLVRLDQTLSSYSILVTLLAIVLLVGALYQFGVLGRVFGLFGKATRYAVNGGFRAWERWLSWAGYGVYLVLAVVVISVGVFAAQSRPEVALVCAMFTLWMGVSACLAYMFIDVERYEVERGRKAVHNPTKGQELAPNVAKYGHRVEVTLLVAAAAAVVGGFALLNQGLYETVGSSWYRVEDGARPSFVDFLTYAFINLLSLVDILDLADSQRLLHATFVRKGAWPAAVLLATFRSFFTLILIQQVFASVRQGRLLSETITDFWSPHEPIHDRARNALPQFGAAAIGPVLVSLREMETLTKEQRDQLPVILAAIGPSTVPILVGHLHDPHEHVRAVAVGTLGHLLAQETVSEIVAMVGDESDLVRLSAVESLGMIAANGVKVERSRRVQLPTRAYRWHFFSARKAVASLNPTVEAINALRLALGDKLAAIRGRAAIALGGVGAAAATTADAIAELLRDADETVRCRAAEALGEVGGAPEHLLAALDDASAPVRAAAARGLKLLGHHAKAAIPRLVELLQDRDEDVRTAASEAVKAAGPLDDDSTSKLTTALTSPDTVVRAHAAEALGSVAAPAEYAAAPLVAALADTNDIVRAKAVEALGKIGETAASVAVPSLVRALRDQDSWVSALAAEALGEMGAAEGVVPGLIRALGHVNPQVRANAAEALGKLGPSAASARASLERATEDEDGGVQSQAVRALGMLGTPPPSSVRLIRAGVTSPDPLVRAAAATAIGAFDSPADEVLADLLPLLRDPNDQVKLQVCEVLSKWAGADERVVAGLCQALSDDDSAWVQASAALALARIGPSAVSAGPTLLRAARTAEAEVREQAMRALVMIQPPEALEAFTAGLTDATAQVRVVASAGWIKATTVPETAGPALVEALRDPEQQVRANVAHTLARLEALPLGAVVALRDCASDPNDGLRLNAALALRHAPPGEVADVMNHLLDDPNTRVRLIAAGAILASKPDDAHAHAFIDAVTDDPSPRVRQAVAELREQFPTPPDEVVAESTATAPETAPRPAVAS